MNVDINTMLLALQDPQTYAHKTEKIELIETHISWVILTGMYAYKIKKPVNMGFLDFSTLAKRKHYCELELVLNKRLAADYYLEVVPVTGSYQQPTLGGGEEVIEYALKMRQFPKDAELDIKLASGVLDKSMMELLAEKIAAFHQQINVADDASSFGDLLHVHQPVLNSYAEIVKHVKDEAVIACLNSLKNWSCNEYERLKEIFLSRKNDGFVRECHGDLHLRNIAIVGDEVIAFDCIEFNEDLRWNDVISEIAFVCMDLDDHHCPELASRFLNHYLALTGDYAGLKVFNYYLVYRATVRAMVSCIRLKQEILT
ncbi:MAG TPA: aminoglycoside phosphotransferase, partial [Gammaproteobacteria bacterium]|nr:aminoglycoside phosphotransferase [Gammaproteobacteria bacterium]